MRPRWIASMAVALLVTGAFSVPFPPLVNVLGLLVVGFALLLPPTAVAGLGALAVAEAALIAAVQPSAYGPFRIVNVTIATVLAVCISMLLERRRHGLAASRRRERDILAAMPEGVAVLDPEGVLRVDNPGLRRLVAGATLGQRLHPLLGHVLADGSACPGGCALDGVHPAEWVSTPVEGERITREGSLVPVAYSVGRYGPDDLVVTVQDVSERVAAQADREVLLQAMARNEEQSALLRALGGSRLRLGTFDDIVVDSWVPDGPRGQVSSALASLTPLPDGRRLLLMVNGHDDESLDPGDAEGAVPVDDEADPRGGDPGGTGPGSGTGVGGRTGHVGAGEPAGSGATSSVSTLHGRGDGAGSTDTRTGSSRPAWTAGPYELARDAWKVLYVARAHLAAGAPLAEMISRAADSLADESDQANATIVGVIIDPVTGFVQVASGGHPAPLLVHRDGSAAWLDAPGRPLGDESPRSVRVAGGELGPGDLLLVYGIGIVDITRDLVEGMSALRSAAIALRDIPIAGAAERIGRAAVPPGVTREQADILLVVRLT